MNPALQSAIATGVVGIILLVLNQRANRRSEAARNAIEERKTDQAGKAVDLSVLTESLDQLAIRVKDLEGDLLEEKKARMRAESRANTAEERARDAERRAGIAERRATELALRAARLEARVSQLEEAMRAQGASVPPPLP